MKDLLLTLRSALLLLLLMGSIQFAAAYDFVSDGIYYKITSSTNMTVAVTYYNQTNNTYSGIITIPEKVTNNGKTYYVTAIGNSAFVGCTGLKGINFVSDKTTTIGSHAFQGCNGLTSFVFPPHITNVGEGAFDGCYGITGIVFEETTNSISLSYKELAQNGGKGLFYDCPLVSVFIGRHLSYNDDISRGYSPFAGITTLEKAHFGNPVNYIENYLFKGCTSLKTLVYNSQCYPTKVGDYAFWSCTSLTDSDIILPESVKTIGEGAFRNCTSLHSYTIPNHVITVGNYAFKNCTRLTNVVIMPSVTSIGNYAFQGCSALTSIVIPANVTSIGNYAFYGCTAMTGVTIEESETTLSVGYGSSNGQGYGLFYDCPLKSVFIGRSLNYSTSSFDGYSPFAYNATLAKAHFGNPVKSIQENLFYGCPSLKTLVYNSQCRPTTISKYAFFGCSALTESDIHYPESVITIENGAFMNCTSLQGYTIPNHVTTVGDYTFQNCTRLASMVIKPSVTSIGNSVFNGCTAMTEVTIEESETTLSLGYNEYNTSNGGKGLFYDCPLVSVFIGRPLSYKTTRVNGYSPFANNLSLSKAQLGKKITLVEDNMFYGCTYLNEVISCSATPPTANANCFANYDAKLYVPKNSVNAYKNAEVWKNFSSITGVDIPDDGDPVIPGSLVGDVDGNGKVNIEDVTTLIQLLLSSH